MNNHPYHLVDYSPWPIIGSVGAMTFVSGLVMSFHQYKMSLLILGFILILLTMVQWWRDVIRESTFQGLHTFKVVSGMKMGMVLFILSEVFFFLSFFWAFFHSSLSPTIELGLNWPPNSILPFNPVGILLLNTMVLLCSGVSITWSHHMILCGNHNSSMEGLLLTVTLGFYFSILQGFEYYEASFNISDSIYGSLFFVCTGFHGIHVLIGTMFIMVTMIRLLSFHFSNFHHFGFEASAWYWHFVDVVWLFLYIFIYWWGS